jgi:hypothetical protein
MDDELSTHATMVRGPTTSTGSRSTGNSNGDSKGDRRDGDKKTKKRSKDGYSISNNNNKRAGKTSINKIQHERRRIRRDGAEAT